MNEKFKRVDLLFRDDERLEQEDCARAACLDIIKVMLQAQLCSET